MAGLVKNRNHVLRTGIVKSNIEIYIFLTLVLFTHYIESYWIIAHDPTHKTNKSCFHEIALKSRGCFFLCSESRKQYKNLNSGNTVCLERCKKIVWRYMQSVCMCRLRWIKFILLHLENEAQERRERKKLKMATITATH